MDRRQERWIDAVSRLRSILLGYRHSCRGYRRDSSAFTFGYCSRQKFVRSSVTWIGR